MITNGIYSSKETPPQVPMITGTPTRAPRKTIEETVASTVTTVVKGSGVFRGVLRVLEHPPKFHLCYEIMLKEEFANRF